MYNLFEWSNLSTKCNFDSQVLQTCDFGFSSLKIVLLLLQVSPPLQNPNPLDFDSVKADVAHFLIKKIDTDDFLIHLNLK